MPCLIITGHPSSGKTTIANKLKERALKHPLIEEVVIVNEESACRDYTKNQCYASAGAEKRTRGALKSEFDRTKKGSKILVILDSLNYIKGLRYELHVISKAAGERHGVLWVLNRIPVVEAWNRDRADSEKYSSDLLKELIQRYEPPDQRNRWDKPLFTIDVAPPPSLSSMSETSNVCSSNSSVNIIAPSTTEACHNDSKTEALSQSVYNMHGLYETMNITEGSNATKNSASTLENPAAAAASVGGDVIARKPKQKRSAFSRAKKAQPEKEDIKSDPTTISRQKHQILEVTDDDIKLVGDSENNNDAKGTPPQAYEQEPQQEDRKTVDEELDEILNNFLLNVQPLKAGAATTLHVATSVNVLQELDSTTTKLISAISNAQTCYTGGKLQIKLPSGETLLMEHKRVVALPELRRLRKQFMTWVASHPPHDSSEKGISEWFVRYIEDQL